MSIVTSKSAVASKTIIINVVIIVAGVLTALSGADIPFVSHALTTGVGATIVAGVNVVLRFLQKKPITMTGGQPVDVDAKS